MITKLCVNDWFDQIDKQTIENPFWNSNWNLSYNYDNPLISYKTENKEDRYVYYVSLPGIDKDKLQLESNIKLIKLSYPDNEKFITKFNLDLNVLEDMDLSSIDAVYEDGILVITILKMEEAKDKKIQIK